MAQEAYNLTYKLYRSVRRRFIKKTPPQPTPQYYRPSYSQEGEDMILARIFDQKKIGFYVDVGAYHPQLYSNTYYFYLQGWRGINIDATPGSMARFNSIRPRDINLEKAIHNTAQTLTYYCFNEPGLNSFDRERALFVATLPHYTIIAQEEIETVPLAALLDEYLPLGQEIDFLDIDVENLDYEVLLSNNWHKYRPKVVLVEALRASLEQVHSLPITLLLLEQGYQLHSKLVNTLIFVKKDD
jgi:FkbM family methyltransferase